MENSLNLHRRGFMKLGLGGAAVLATGSSLALLTGCSSGSDAAAEGYLHLRPSDLVVLEPWVPVILSEGARPEGDADVLRALKLLDMTLENAGPLARKMLFELYDVLHLGAFRWWATGYWSDPATLTLTERKGSLERWEHINSSFGRAAFRGLTAPVMSAWYLAPDNARSTGYPGPPKKIAG